MYQALLEARFLLITVGTLLSDHVVLGQILCMLITLGSLILQLKFEPFAEASEEDAGKWSSLNSQARNALGCQFVAMVLGFLSTLVLGQGVLGTVVAVGTLLIFVLPAVMTVVIETTALRELSGQMADKLQEAADEEAQVTESPLRGMGALAGAARGGRRRGAARRGDDPGRGHVHAAGAAAAGRRARLERRRRRRGARGRRR